MLPETRRFGLAILAGGLLMPALAFAQAPPPAQKDPLPPKEDLSGPKDCVQTQHKKGDGVDVEGGEGRSFSERLAKGQGVLCPPPNVDPEMTKPAPGGGTMPVIPPPGSDEDHKGIEPK